MSMFERFNDDAREAMSSAKLEATRLRHSWIGTEHLLLGLLAASGPAAEVLRSFKITQGFAREEVESIVGGRDDVSGAIPFTPRAKKCLELSLREALRLGHTSITDLHLLLSLIREGDGLAPRVIRMKAALDEVADAALDRLGVEVPGGREDDSQVDVVRFALTFAEVLGDWAKTGHRLSERAKRASSFAFEEADVRGSEEIDVDDLLVSLMREPTNASRVLESFGITIDELRRRLRRERGEDEEGNAAGG